MEFRRVLFRSLDVRPTRCTKRKGLVRRTSSTGGEERIAVGASDKEAVTPGFRLPRTSDLKSSPKSRNASSNELPQIAFSTEPRRCGLPAYRASRKASSGSARLRTSAGCFSKAKEVSLVEPILPRNFTALGVRSTATAQLGTDNQRPSCPP